MKRISAAGVFVALALWVGYALGYTQGKRHERAAWESTGVVVFDKDFSPPTPEDKVALPSSKAGEDDTDGLHTSRMHFYYTNPHAGIVVPPPGGHAVNTADPRSVPLK